MTRLKVSEVKAAREALLINQGQRCAVCQAPCRVDQACLDHDHKTGAVRGVLHRGCNALLGKIENNAARYGVTNIAAFTSGVGGYLRMHMTNVHGMLHPSHRTAEEKRVRRNTKARKTRAANRESA